LKFPLPLTALTASVFWAYVITACAIASEFWSRTVDALFSYVSHAAW
jgi:hypothetical protein